MTEITDDDDVTVHPEDRWILELARQDVRAPIRDSHRMELETAALRLGMRWDSWVNQLVRLGLFGEVGPHLHPWSRDFANDLRSWSSVPTDHLATPLRRYFADPHAICLSIGPVALP